MCAFIIRWRGLISFGETSEEDAAAAATTTTTASTNARLCLALRSQAGSQPRPGKQPRSGEEEPVTERPVSRCSVKAVITARKHERGKTGCTAIHAVQHSNGTRANRQVSANISPLCLSLPAVRLSLLLRVRARSLCGSFVTPLAATSALESTNCPLQWGWEAVGKVAK